MIYISKHKEEDSDTECINVDDISKYYKSYDEKYHEAYFFIDGIVKPVVEYFNFNSSTAFGNPDLARMEGKLIGYCLGKGWIFEENSERILITSQKGRKLYYIEKPCTPQQELEKRKDIDKMWGELLG